MTERRISEVVEECMRQQEACLYTSTALYEWLKEVRIWRVVFIVAPIIFGGIASARILAKTQEYEWVVAICSLIAGLFPAVFKVLDLDVSLKTISDAAHRFKVLQDRFRQAGKFLADKTVEDVEGEFEKLMDRMDDARSASPAIPERHFKKSQKKIKQGNYDFSVDMKRSPIDEHI